MKQVSVASFRRAFPVGTEVATLPLMRDLEAAGEAVLAWQPTSYPEVMELMAPYQMALRPAAGGPVHYLTFRGLHAWEVTPDRFILLTPSVNFDPCCQIFARRPA